MAQYYTQGTEYPEVAIALLTGTYGFKKKEIRGMVTRDDYLPPDGLLLHVQELHGDFQGEFQVSFSGEGNLDPTPSNLEHQIVAHLLQVGSTKRLLSAFQQPVSDEIFQRLLACHTPTQ